MAKNKEASEGAGAAKYDASKIDKLEGLEAVRKRPGMYIGDPDERGLHHCVFEVLDNSIDEHLAGYCKHITVIIHVDGSVSIRDDGRGIPVDKHPKFKIPAVELVLTNLHAGGKFGQGAYKYSGGLHGVGAKCVNALSEWFKVEVSRDGKVHTMEFSQGKTTRKLEVIGMTKNTGTYVVFKPDPAIFTITQEFQFNMLATRMRELAFLNPGVEITLVDDREDKKSETFYEFEPEENEILNDLLPKNISTQIFKAFLENAASEQGSRMTAMDNATRNAGDLVDKLTINYNRSRQASITKELIEIISGAESL